MQASFAIIKLIADYLDCLDVGKYEKIAELLCQEEKNEFEEFISSSTNRENHIGFFNYTGAKLVSIKAYEGNPQSLGFNATDYDHISNISCWDCVVRVTTYKDSEYLKSGNNRFIFGVGLTKLGQLVILGTIRDKNWSEDADESDPSLVAPMTIDAPVSAPSSGTWTTPATIKVRYNGTTQTVDFKQYCYVVTANEFGTDSYNQAARIAVALAVKNYGWNRTLVQKYPNYDYDVKATTSDQEYNPSKTVTAKVKSAVNAIWDYVMLSCDYKLFCGFHVQSVAINDKAIYHGGVLSQLEANELAEDEYSWESILHYYYDYGIYNPEMTSGVIRIVPLSHSAAGSSYHSSKLYHWIVCNTCGCIHSKVAHTWTYNSNKSLFVCVTCGRTATSIPVISSLGDTQI